MDLITELNQAIEYIENNLDGELELEEIAKVTSYSPYHFQRIFNYITGIPLSEYIRKRRLSMAVFDLQNNEKVLDVALKYGYQSADSFTRAFEKQHGVKPSQLKSETVSMNLYPPLSFELKVQGEKALACRIEPKEAFNMFGMSTRISTDWSENKAEIGQFLNIGKQEHWYDTMNSIYGYDPDMMLHRAYYDREGTQVNYMVCQYMKDGVYVPDYYSRIHIPGGLWAVFHSDGEDLAEIWPRIYNEWLPYAGYDLESGPALELYFGNARKGNVRGEIMIPIKKSETNARKISSKRHSAHTKEEWELNSKYRVVEFVYEEKWNQPLNQMYTSVMKKYPNGIYWSYDPRSREGKHVFLCLDEQDHVIGKAHTMIVDKQGDDAPGYAEHRIFMHYRVLPEYENYEVLDLLYDRVLECAKELRNQLSNRVCQVVVGNFDYEKIYNQHIQSKGWPEFGSVYYLTADTDQVDPMVDEIGGIQLHLIDLNSMDMLNRLVKIEQICFRDCVAAIEFYRGIGRVDHYAYGAYITDHEGKEQLIGAVIVTTHDYQEPELACCMILPEYRRKHLASTMIRHVLAIIHQKGYENVWLIIECDDQISLDMYKKAGFRISKHEMRFMKYI